jgi:hypothetical protein
MSSLAALQDALAAEDAVIYGYGVVGAHLSGTAEQYATDRLTTHMQRRDTLSGLVVAAGGIPVAAMPAYRLPFVVSSARIAGLLAARLERSANDACWDIIAATAAGSTARSLGIGWLRDSAVSAAHWGASQALPGQPT